MNLDMILNKAAKWRRSGDTDLWAIAWLASQVIDEALYGEAAVFKFGQIIKRSGRTVYNLAGAWNTYCDLRRVYTQQPEMWPMLNHFFDLRAELPYSHFKAMGDLIRRFEFSPQEAICYLVDAWQLGYSADKMEEQVTSEQTTRKPPDSRKVFAASTHKAVFELERASMNAPDEATAQDIIQALKVVKQALGDEEQGPAWLKSARIVHTDILAFLQKRRIPGYLRDKLGEAADTLSKAIDDNEKEA